MNDNKERIREAALNAGRLGIYSPDVVFGTPVKCRETSQPGHVDRELGNLCQGREPILIGYLKLDGAPVLVQPWHLEDESEVRRRLTPHVDFIEDAVEPAERQEQLREEIEETERFFAELEQEQEQEQELEQEQTLNTESETMTNEIYSAGTKAVIDSLFSGLIPCQVIKVIEPGHGTHANSGLIEVMVTEDMNGYHDGEIVRMPASSIVPRKQLRKRGHRINVNINYTWQ